MTKWKLHFIVNQVDDEHHERIISWGSGEREEKNEGRYKHMFNLKPHTHTHSHKPLVAGGYKTIRMQIVRVIVIWVHVHHLMSVCSCAHIQLLGEGKSQLTMGATQTKAYTQVNGRERHRMTPILPLNRKRDERWINANLNLHQDKYIKK